jgi:hypothetical protein
MQFLSAIQSLIPRGHAFIDEERYVHLGVTFKDGDGLTDKHNLAIKYTRNCERLARERGDAMPDGSFRYVDPVSGMVHTMSADRVSKFTKKTSQDAAVLMQMLSKMEAVSTESIDTTASAA